MSFLDSLCKSLGSNFQPFSFQRLCFLWISRFILSVIVCAWRHTLDYLCVCSYGRETECVCETCFLYYKTVCKYFTSHSWTFDKKLYKTAENRSIWDKSWIRRIPLQNYFVTTSGQVMCKGLLLHREVCTFNIYWCVFISFLIWSKTS